MFQIPPSEWRTSTNLAVMTDSTVGPEADARRADLLAILNGGTVAAKDAGQPDGEDAAEDSAGAPTSAEPTAVAPAANALAPNGAHWSLIMAIVWAVAAAIIGLVFIFGVSAETYGGDAYTGIEGAIVSAVHAIGWVIVSSGVLGLVLAGTRVSQTK